MTPRFDEYYRRKTEAAMSAEIPGYATAYEQPPQRTVVVGNAWSRNRFDGGFYRHAEPRHEATPVTSLVFVQSLDRNTGATDPSTLGGGNTDLHLVYEGLSRVDADAVLAGAATAQGKDMVFSVWHPELVALRFELGKPRHPAQVVVTRSGNLRFDDGLMFLEPDLRVFVITRTGTASAIRRRVEGRAWIEVIDAGEPMSFVAAFRALRARGISVISCVGGRQTATALINEGVVSDIYLTTAATPGGEPDTPFYEGPPLRLVPVVTKEGLESERGVRFEHLVPEP